MTENITCKIIWLGSSIKSISSTDIIKQAALQKFSAVQSTDDYAAVRNVLRACPIRGAYNRHNGMKIIEHIDCKLS